MEEEEEGGLSSERHMDGDKQRKRRRRRRRKGGRKTWGKGGRDKLKEEEGERFSIPPLAALRLSLAVLIHGFSGL